MKRLFCLALACLFSHSFLQAQEDAPIDMTPQLPLAFPFVQQGQEVHVKYPVMINPTTILNPDVILRVIYQLPPASSGLQQANDMTLIHHASMAAAYSRSTAMSKDPDVSPELVHMLEGMRRITWTTPNNFQLSLAQYPLTYIHLIYGLPRKDKEQDIVDQIFSFFDGMFVGLPGSNVTIIAVENKSKADQAGIKADDEILSVGGLPIHGDLNAFADAYAKAKDAAQFNQQSNYSLVVRAPGGPERTIQVAMPPSLNSDLLMEGVPK